MRTRGSTAKLGSVSPCWSLVLSFFGSSLLGATAAWLGLLVAPSTAKPSTRCRMRWGPTTASCICCESPCLQTEPVCRCLHVLEHGPNLHSGPDIYNQFFSADFDASRLANSIIQAGSIAGSLDKLTVAVGSLESELYKQVCRCAAFSA